MKNDADMRSRRLITGRIAIIVAVTAFSLVASPQHLNADEEEERDISRFKASRAPEHAVWLDALDLSKATQGWGTPQKGRSVDKNPIQIDGDTFHRGFGTHATSVLSIRLNGAATKFESLVGVDDEVEGEASVRFVIIVDDEMVARTPVMHAGDAPQHLSAELSNAEQMSLIVTDGGDGSN